MYIYIYIYIHIDVYNGLRYLVIVLVFHMYSMIIVCYTMVVINASLIIFC